MEVPIEKLRELEGEINALYEYLHTLSVDVGLAGSKAFELLQKIREMEEVEGGGSN